MSLLNETSFNFLNRSLDELNRYFTLVIFCFGVIGNVINIFVLSQRNLRTNSCGWLFLMSSIANLLAILFGLTTRIQAGWSHDPTETISWICKLRVFVVFTSRTAAFWLLTFATIDRWLLSSMNANHRKRSTLKNAHHATSLIIFISICLYVQMFYCYEANQIETPLKCYGKNLGCRYSTDILYVFVTVVSPLLTMFVFGVFTILNIKQSQRRVRRIMPHASNHHMTVSSTDTPQKRQQKNIDRRLLFMLLIQILLLTLFTVPQAMHKIYTTLTEHDPISANENLEIFIYNLVSLLSFIANGIPFYIYTLCGGKLFHTALYNVFKIVLKRVLCQSQ